MTIFDPLPFVVWKFLSWVWAVLSTVFRPMAEAFARLGAFVLEDLAWAWAEFARAVNGMPNVFTYHKITESVSMPLWVLLLFIVFIQFMMYFAGRYDGVRLGRECNACHETWDDGYSEGWDDGFDMGYVHRVGEEEEEEKNKGREGESHVPQ